MVNILVIENEQSITQTLKDTLEIDEDQAVTVLDSEDAVQFALRETPHLIILDLMAPHIDGYEVTRRLRNHPKTMHIPIIVLSARGSSEDKVHAYELGVDAYLTKPLDTAELMATVRRQLRRLQQSSPSPLTGLPGGTQLELAINHTINSLKPWSILYLDLTNFKAFNDVYGFLAGNSMIMLVGHTCQQVVYEYGNTTDFVGHIGGDDFIIMTTPDRVNTLCQHILARYKQRSTSLYRPEDLARGLIDSTDREGSFYQFPLASLTIGTVSNQVRIPCSLEYLGMAVAEAKHSAKLSPSKVCHLALPSRSKLLQNESQSSSSFYYSLFSCHEMNVARQRHKVERGVLVEC